MPPVRTAEKKKKAKETVSQNGTLFAMGFQRNSQQERAKALAKDDPESELVLTGPVVEVPRTSKRSQDDAEFSIAESDLKPAVEPGTPAAVAPPVASTPPRDVNSPKDVIVLEDVKPSQDVKSPQDVKPAPKKALPKPPKREPGTKDVHIPNNYEWENLKREIGTKTKKLSFGSKWRGFRLAE